MPQAVLPAPLTVNYALMVSWILALSAKKVVASLVDQQVQLVVPAETNSLSTKKCVPTAVMPALDAQGWVIPSVRHVQIITLARLAQTITRRVCRHQSARLARQTAISRTSSARAMERSDNLTCIVAMTSEATQPNLALSQPTEMPHIHSESLLARPAQIKVIVKRILSANQVPARYDQEMTALLIKINVNRYLRVNALVRIRNA